MPSLQEEQRLASSRQAKGQAEQQLQAKAKATSDITCGVDQVPQNFSLQLDYCLTCVNVHRPSAKQTSSCKFRVQEISQDSATVCYWISSNIAC